MKRLALAVVAAIVAIVALVGYHAASATAVSPHRDAVRALPAPTTAAGYAAMFAKLPTAEWGGGDVSLSVQMSATRSVWLYGDTLSDDHGIVNSTAITQDGGRLHISHEGNQLLPQASDDARGRTVVYWIEAARRASADEISVTVVPEWVVATGQVGAGFGRETAKDRTALVTVSPSGDVDFTRWTGWTAAPKLDTRFLNVAEGAPFQKPGVLFYGAQRHPEARLAGGRTLITICRNSVAPARLANGSIDYRAYRPVFSAR